MRNPLIKRLPREFKSDLGKYLVMFLFMTAAIGFISGFLVAGSSMIKAYNESFDKYNIEDGNFELSQEADDALIERIEKEDVTIYENYYVEKDVTQKNGENITESTLRIFKNRKDVDKICVMKGELPVNSNEIAIDRMYADNNKINVGDNIKMSGKEYKVTGYVALSDYSALFSDNSDMMFDSVKFGVAIVTDECFDKLSDVNVHYVYSWKYDNKPENDTEEKEQSDKFLKKIGATGLVTNYTPAYLNQAIHFTGDDLGSDKSMIEVLLYVIIVILAFVFAVTTNNTITKEANVIGTLRASGYKKSELLGHYITMPVIVTILAAIIGNILGYTYFKNIVANMYYGSYSLPTYVTIWNAEAFIKTTVIPLILMIIINVLVISRKLSLSPLDFLRRNLTRKKKKKAVRLPKFKFFNRFRLRIIFQNMSSYVTLFVGMLFANVLLLFGMMMVPLLNHYQNEVTQSQIADYQYILKTTTDVNVSYSNAEKYCVTSLETTGDKEESITIYGIADNSKYIDFDIPKEGVAISDGYASKYNVKKGDTISLKEKYKDKIYEFVVEDIVNYPPSLSVFMSSKQYNEEFMKQDRYYNGYFSDKKLDIDDKKVASIITVDDLTKVSRQLEVSMGESFNLIFVFSIALFILLVYLLTKLIIEKNTTSISMVKILGYTNAEIGRLYLISTTWVIIISQIITIGLSTVIMNWLYKYFMAKMTGWLTLYYAPKIFPEMFMLGLLVYAVVAAFQLIKIHKIPMDEALKNVE
ncbi:MAG: ABC transporter permease [Lachnospira sp.]|nr:ABC transporter permease [Lachnospira sp.]